jgi:lipid II:glycine glycyltransferase (peptidoglycan interpeptide bridge formation enzyme)
MPEISLAEWHEFLKSYPDAHLLQTGEWGELKLAFGWEPVRIWTENLGVQILFRRLPLGFTLAYMPKPVADHAQWTMDDDFWTEVDAVCKRKQAIFLKIELDLWDSQLPEKLNRKFETSPHNIQPPRTIIVDLNGSEDDILARMKQKTRYNIRLAGKKGVTVRPWDDIPAFHKMMLVTGGRDGFGVHSLEYYQRAYELFHPSGMCELLVAEYEDVPLAALMVFGRGRRAWYIYGASTDEGRNLMPTYLLQWEAMRWARTKGCREYDLWGVPDADDEALEANFETRRDGLWGVYRFKRGFGGQVRRAAQAVDRVYMPVLYRFYLLWMRRRGAVD